MGGFPDRELVTRYLLQPVLNLIGVLDSNGDPILDEGVPRRPEVVSHLPADYTKLLPLIRVYRGGGAADRGALADPASVQLATICDTREESWALAEFIRQWMLSYSRGGPVKNPDGSYTLVDEIAELNGPQLVPELNPDIRMIPITYRVQCRRPRGLPDYQVVREGLNL